MREECDFLLANIERFLGARPAASDVRSMWSGQRPLVRQPDKSSTAAISRDHTILISSSRLVTITGGKWTTYRRMGQDAIDKTTAMAQLPSSKSVTADLKLHGWTSQLDAPDKWSRVYGCDVPVLERMIALSPELGRPLHADLPFRRAEAVWGAKYEMARTVEDILSRRTRALFLDARAAVAAAPETARLMAEALGRDEAWQKQQVKAFEEVAQNYIWTGETE
jgi:glycerol-3-phosphate dehydrogenase